jgi:hypothetical protein
LDCLANKTYVKGRYTFIEMEEEVLVFKIGTSNNKHMLENTLRAAVFKNICWKIGEVTFTKSLLSSTHGSVIAMTILIQPFSLYEISNTGPVLLMRL